MKNTNLNINDLLNRLENKKTASQLFANGLDQSEPTKTAGEEVAVEPVVAEPVVEPVTEEPVVEEVVAEPVTEEVTAEPVVEEDVEKQAAMEKVAEADQYGRIIARSFNDELTKLGFYSYLALLDEVAEPKATTEKVAEVDEDGVEKLAAAQNILLTLYNQIFSEVDNG
jgi:hypothetical protein